MGKIGTFASAYSLADYYLINAKVRDIAKLILDGLLGIYLRGLTRERVEDKFIYAFHRIAQLIEEGRVSKNEHGPSHVLFVLPTAQTYTLEIPRTFVLYSRMNFFPIPQSCAVALEKYALFRLIENGAFPRIVLALAGY